MLLLNPRYYAPLLMVAIALTGLIGCSSEPAEPDTPPPPPPPSPEEIAQGIIGELQLNAPLPAAGSKLAPDAAANFLSALRTANTKNASNPDGERAMRIVSQKLDSRLRELEGNKLWEHVETYVKGHKLLNAGSKKFDHVAEMAERELTKAVVTVKAFFTDGNTGETAAFLDFYLPKEKTTDSYQVRIGEEFHGLKLVGIIGNNQGVTMEYMETDQTFDVLIASAQK